MFKFSKTLVCISIISILTACADSASINQQAAMGYRQMISEAKVKGQLDTQSQTAQRVHKIFNKITQVNRLTGKLKSLNLRNLTHGQCRAVKWHFIPA